MTLREENALLKQEIVELKQEITNSKQFIAKLQQCLLEYKVKKDSSNSSIPPSQETFRSKKTSSLREKNGKKSGGHSVIKELRYK